MRKNDVVRGQRVTVKEAAVTLDGADVVAHPLAGKEVTVVRVKSVLSEPIVLVQSEGKFYDIHLGDIK